MRDRPLSQRIYEDPAYTALVRFVRFTGVPYPISKYEADRLAAEYGKENMVSAAADLLNYDTVAKLATLKSSVRVHCRQLLGPLPEEWDEFYANVENPPPNPYKVKPAVAASTQDLSSVELATAERSREALLDKQSNEVELDFGPRRMVPSPEMTAEDMVRKLTDDVLQKLIDDAEAGVKYHGARSYAGRNLKRDLAMAQTEQARRREEAGQPSELDLIRSMHGRKLRSLLHSQHVLLQNYPPPDATHLETIQRLDMLEAEMLRRGNKVPPRPKMPTIESPTDDRAEDIDFVAQALANTIEMETGMECIVAHPDELRRFAEANTQRLKELLDMAQYEMTAYLPTSVTFQEAARDIALISAELRRRKAD